MRKITFILLFFWFGLGFSQTKQFYVQDQENTYSFKTIQNASFKEFKSLINNGFKNGVYWLKIQVDHRFTMPFIVQIPNYHISKANAYQSEKEINKLSKERFISFKFSEKETVFIKVHTKKEAFIPLVVFEEQEFQHQEKKNILFSGFYYGFSFIIILINIFYYITFKDDTFLYYAFFLLAISCGLFLSDGLLSLTFISPKLLDFLQVIDRFFVTILSGLFALSYTQAKNYYPKIKYFSFLFNGTVLIFGVIYLINNDFVYFVATEVTVFIALIFYWTVGLFLFRKNSFTKIFVIAYSFILILAIQFYITKLFGFYKIDASLLKLGGFFEMIILSFAVIYRMKTLQDSNTKMRDEIVKYVKEIKSLSEKIEKPSTLSPSIIIEANLTTRESEILECVASGKTNQEIGDQLFISINTVKYHVKNLYDKLNIKSRKEVQNLQKMY